MKMFLLKKYILHHADIADLIRLNWKLYQQYKKIFGITNQIIYKGKLKGFKRILQEKLYCYSAT